MHCSLKNIKQKCSLTFTHSGLQNFSILAENSGKPRKLFVTILWSVGNNNIWLYGITSQEIQCMLFELSPRLNLKLQF